MCGINGYVSSHYSADDLSSMNTEISHRGPDASGIWVYGNTGLGHVRLAIQDVSSSGDQPFIKDDLIIVFNGEIYNFNELKTEYLDCVEFYSSSDTEVVLEMWRKYGVDAINKLRGMYSFAIYEKETGKTFLVRDPFGIKPLFYLEDSNGILFSSELKAIHCVSKKLELDHNAIASSLAYVWIPENQCIYKEVKKLSPGVALEISGNGAIKKIDFCNLKSLISSKPLINSEREAIEILESTLKSSVKSHLVSDVPVGAFLSGGLDSSLIVAMAREHLPEIDCFTIQFSDRDKNHESMTDDAFYARKVAKDLGVDLTTIEVKPDLSELLPKIVHHLDEPIGDSAAISTFLICDSARKAGVKVLLSGMGADEMFAGYRKHYANTLAKKYRLIPKPIRNVGESYLNNINVSSTTKGNKLSRWAKRFISFAGMNEDDAFFRSYTYYDLNEIENSFSDSRSIDVGQIKEYHHEMFNFAKSMKRGLIDSMCFTDTNHFMTSLNLTYTDRASMAASTEVRVPFIDLDVAKVAFNIDEVLKIKNGQQKYILKKVAERWLSNEIIYRPKSSFTLPLRSWIKNDLSGMVDDYLLADDGLSGRKIFKPSFIRSLVRDEMSGKEDNSQKLWHLLTLEQWFKNQNL